MSNQGSSRDDGGKVGQVVGNAIQAAMDRKDAKDKDEKDGKDE